MKLENGWINTATKIESDNFDQRPTGVIPELLIIHCISLPPGKFSGSAVSDLFTNQLDPQSDPYFSSIMHLHVSAHLVIRRDGGLFQYVSTDNRAWHAGESIFSGRSNVNNFSIGIELEGLDSIPFESSQYGCLVKLTRCLQKNYPLITNERILGHQHIAPGRKYDPGCGFQWYHYLSQLS